MSLRTPPPQPKRTLRLARRLMAAGAACAALWGCRAPAQQAGDPPLALGIRDAPGILAVKAWSAPCAPDFGTDLGKSLLLRFVAKHPGKLQLRGEEEVELEFETDLSGFEAFAELDMVFACTLAGPEYWTAPPARQSQDSAGWKRRAALCMPEQTARPVSVAALAPRAEFDQVARALRSSRAKLSAQQPAAPTISKAELPTTESLLVESSASLPSEVRWIAPAELQRGQPRERALWCLRAARLAAEVPGWSFVPSGVDLLGRFEPAHLYTSGDVPATQQRLKALRTALEANGHLPLDPAGARREFALREARLRFARAQLSSELFRLRALHYDCLGGFELLASELESLKLTDLKALDPSHGLCSVVGPSAAWADELGPFTLVQPRYSAQSLEPDVDAELQRLWSAIGGLSAWRELSALRIQSQLDVEGSTRSQGIEQWIDFANQRFVLSQAIGTRETLVVVSAARAWSPGVEAPTELSGEQAQRLRNRQERTLFAVLRRLAQAQLGGLQITREGERLRLRDGGRELCWLELDSAGLPLRLGYRLDGESEDSLYEFRDWKLDAPLAYPVRTLQIDRKATVEIRTFEPGATPGAQIWEHSKR